MIGLLPIRWISGYCNGTLPPTPKPLGGPLPIRTRLSPFHVTDSNQPHVEPKNAHRSIRCLVCRDKVVTEDAKFCERHEESFADPADRGPLEPEPPTLKRFHRPPPMPPTPSSKCDDCGKVVGGGGGHAIAPGKKLCPTCWRDRLGTRVMP